MKALVIVFISMSLFSSTERIQEFSKIFLNIPYQADPLGEGSLGEFDQDPLFRFDAFDCTTYVETILALALSESENEFKAKINDIRYNSSPSFLNRNHFISLDWIDDNKNILKDITSELSPNYKTKTTTINKPNWYKKMGENRIQGFDISHTEMLIKLKNLRSLSQKVSSEKSTIDYITIDEVIENSFINKIPNGSIINVVRPSWNLTNAIGTRLHISHQGILIRNSKGTFLRHASSGLGKVADSDFKEYFSKYVNHSEVKGINILKIH